jgi:hypothetical protein
MLDGNGPMTRFDSLSSALIRDRNFQTAGVIIEKQGYFDGGIDLAILWTGTEMSVCSLYGRQRSTKHEDSCAVLRPHWRPAFLVRQAGILE